MFPIHCMDQHRALGDLQPSGEYPTPEGGPFPELNHLETLRPVQAHNPPRESSEQDLLLHLSEKFRNVPLLGEKGNLLHDKKDAELRSGGEATRGGGEAKARQKV